MTKKQAETYFREIIKPAVIAHYGNNDKPALREAWNDYTDQLCKGEEITARQYNRWLCAEHPGDAKDNAARIVSCVNALAGLNPDAIKGLVEAAERAKDHLIMSEGHFLVDGRVGQSGDWEEALSQ